MITWVLPVIGFIVSNAVLGITSKLALREVSWRELIVWAAVSYAVVGLILLAGGAALPVATDTGWVIAVAILVPSTLVLLFLALRTGEVSRVVPIGAAYPAVTVIAAALFLDEPLTAPRLFGTALVILGVVLVSVEFRSRR